MTHHEFDRGAIDWANAVDLDRVDLRSTKLDITALDTATTAVDLNGASALRVQQDARLTATYAQIWRPLTAYLAGARVVNPTGDVVTAIATFTSGASYVATNWAVPATYVTQARVALNVLNYGVSTSATAAANVIGIRAAVTAARAQNRPIYIPASPYGAAIQTNERIDVSSVNIYGDGRWSRIQQTVIGGGVFYVNGVDTVIEGLHLSSSAGRDISSITDDVNDPTTGISNIFSAIWIEPGSDRSIFRTLWVDGMHAGINLVANTGAPQTLGLIIDNLECNNVSFGILGRRWKNAHFNNIRGNYSLGIGVSYPPHLIYISGDFATLTTEAVQITHVQAWDGAVGAAVKLNGIISGTMSDVVATNCRGIFDIFTVNDFTISEFASINDNNSATDPGPIKASIMLDTCIRVSVRSGKILFKNIDHSEAIQTTGAVASSDCVVADVEVVANFLTAQTNENSVILRAYGTNNTFDNISINNIGADRGSAFFLRSSTGTRVNNPRVSGNIRFGLYIRESTSGSQINYDPAHVIVKTSLTNARAIYVDSNTAETPLLKIPVSPSAEFEVPLAYEGGARGAADSPGFSNWASGQLVSLYGTWTHDTDNSVYNSGNNSMGSTLMNAAQANVEMEARIKFGGTKVGFALRAVGSDDQNYLVAGLTATGVTIDSRTTGGSLVNVATSAALTLTTGRRYTFRVAIFGAQIDCYLDGISVLSTTLTGGTATTFATATRWGHYASGASAARFLWTRLRSLA